MKEMKINVSMEDSTYADLIAVFSDGRVSGDAPIEERKDVARVVIETALRDLLWNAYVVAKNEVAARVALSPPFTVTVEPTPAPVEPTPVPVEPPA